VDSFAIRAYPGRTVADAPPVLGKAFRADLKAAGAVPAEGLLFLAAMAFEFSGFAASVAAFLFLR
jgi:hypothetical protein